MFIYNKNMKMIVFSGSACSGKTTIIKEFASNSQILIVNEAARDLFSCNFKEKLNPKQIQMLILAMQIIREQAAIRLAERNKNIKFIFCDRGVLDGAAFCNIEEMKSIYDFFGIDANVYTRNYTLAFLLETIATFDLEKFCKLRPDLDSTKEIARNKKLFDIWSQFSPTLLINDKQIIQREKKIGEVIKNLENADKVIYKMEPNQLKRVEIWLEKMLDLVLYKNSNYENLINNNKLSKHQNLTKEIN